MKRKLIALLLACGMIMGMIGCGSEEKESTEEKGTTEEKDSDEKENGEDEDSEESTGVTFPLEEAIEIDVFACVGNDPYYLEDTWIMQWMEEQTNVKLNITNVSFDELEEKRNVMINSDDYPDVFLKAGLGTEDIYELGQEGILVDLTDMIEKYAPNYSSLLDAEDAWSATRSADGKIYSTVEFSANGVQGPHMLINQQWLDNLSLEMPTSTDELYDVLKAFKENDADGDGDPNNEVPMMFASADILTVEAIWNYFGVNHQDWCQYFELTDDGEIRFFPATEEYKEILAYLTKLYKEGLINQDCFTLTCEQQRALGQTGTSIGVCFEWGSWATFGQYVEGENETGAEYVCVLPFEGNDGKMANSKGYNPGVFAITDKCEYPEIMVAWMDLLYSYEGSMISLYGFEGEQYEVVDGMAKFIGEWDADTARPYLLHLSGCVSKPVDNINTLKSYIDPVEKPLNYARQEYYDELEEKNLYFDVWPTLSFDEEETEVNSKVAADTETYFQNYRAQVITGEIDLDSTWDEYIETLESMGIRDEEANYNAAYERAVK